MSQPLLDVEARMGEAVAAIGYLPAIAPAVVSTRIYDAASYHRSSVLKDAKGRYPSGRRMQKFLAARLFVYGRTTGRSLPTKMSQVKGESFAAEGRDGLLRRLEEGGTTTTAKPMAIKLDPSLSRAKFEQMLESNELEVVPGRGLLINVTNRRRKVAGNRAGLRTEVVGILRRRVQFDGRLGFMDRWQQNLPKVLAKFDADMKRLVTEAGRASLEYREQTSQRARAAGKAAFDAFLSSNPGNARGARKAAAAASQAVKRDRLAQRRGSP